MSTPPRATYFQKRSGSSVEARDSFTTALEGVQSEAKDGKGCLARGSHVAAKGKPFLLKVYGEGARGVESNNAFKRFLRCERA